MVAPIKPAKIAVVNFFPDKFMILSSCCMKYVYRLLFHELIALVPDRYVRFPEGRSREYKTGSISLWLCLFLYLW